jgi:putative addiction module CopG family antidote
MRLRAPDHPVATTRVWLTTCTKRRVEISMSAPAAMVEHRSPMSLNIPPDFERAVRERVESGAYASTDDVLQACLDALERDESSEAAKLDALRRDVQVAMDQYERGEYSRAEDVFARLHERLARSPHS